MNCIIYALQQFRYRSYDYLMLRKSHWALYPHVAHITELEDGTLIKREYVPDEDIKHWWTVWSFKGHVETTVYCKKPGAH